MMDGVTGQQFLHNCFKHLRSQTLKRHLKKNNEKLLSTERKSANTNYI